MTLSRLIWFVFILTILFPPTISAAANDNLFPPAEYIHSKFQQNDIVVLGRTHKKPEILKFIAELIPNRVSHVGLEIPSDQQEKIDAFMLTGKGLDEIQLHIQIDCPEYRHLLEVLRKSDGPTPVAIDSPYSLHGGTISRDEWMARSLLIVY